MARLRRLSPAAAQPASADGTPSASRARGRAATSAQPRIPGGRHRSRPSRRDAAAYPLGPAVNGPPARPGWDADQAVAALYHAHYRALTRLAALLVCDVAAAGEIVQAAFAAMHGAWRHLRDYEKAQAYLLRAVVIRARSHRAAAPPCPAAGRPCARPDSQPSPPRKPYSWRRFTPFQQGSAKPWCSGITRACRTPRSPPRWGSAHTR